MYIFTCADYFTKWVEAFPLKMKDASKVAQCLCWIFNRHRAPETVSTDNGKEFVNKVHASSYRSNSVQTCYRMLNTKGVLIVGGGNFYLKQINGVLVTRGDFADKKPVVR